MFLRGGFSEVRLPKLSLVMVETENYAALFGEITFPNQCDQDLPIGEIRQPLMIIGIPE
jgi:hypothetical protein